MSNLVTLPTFIFRQGELHEGGELPIQVIYYRDGVIELNQEGQEIIIQYDYLRKLFNEIKKHYPEAMRKIEKS